MTHILYRQRLLVITFGLLAWFMVMFKPIQPKYIYIDNPDYISCFSKKWFINNQRTILFLSNSKITRSWFRWVLRINKDCPKDKDIIGILPNCYTWGNSDGSYTTDFRTHNKFSKRLFYSFKPVWWLFHQWDIYIANRFAPQLNLGFDTLTVYPDADPESTSVDGMVAHGSEGGLSWVSIVGASGFTSSDTSTTNYYCYILSGASTDLWNSLARAIFLFDTSSLGLSATINDATLSLYGYQKYDKSGSWAPDLNIYSSNPNSNTALILTDYATLGSTAFSTAITYSGFNTSGYNDFALNSSGIDNISKTGVSKFGSRNANYDVAINSPTWYQYKDGTMGYLMGYFADQTGTTYDPKLVVNYTTGGGGGYSNGLIMIMD